MHYITVPQVIIQHTEKKRKENQVTSYITHMLIDASSGPWAHVLYLSVNRARGHSLEHLVFPDVLIKVSSLQSNCQA